MSSCSQSLVRSDQWQLDNFHIKGPRIWCALIWGDIAQEPVTMKVTHMKVLAHITIPEAVLKHMVDAFPLIQVTSHLELSTSDCTNSSAGSTLHYKTTVYQPPTPSSAVNLGSSAPPFQPVIVTTPIFLIAPMSLQVMGELLPY